ncbi:MAG: hypothetical protein EOP14_03905, partial [Pseudomonas sp.]
VLYRTVPGVVNPATAGSDYISLPSTRLTFPVGNTSQTIKVRVKGDAVDEDDETFQVVLSNPTGGSLTNADTATGTILDDDDTPIVSVSNFTGNEGNGGGATTNFPFVISLDRPSAKTVTVNYATAAVNATDTTDYITASGTVTFNPGVVKQTVNVRVVADTIDEPTETFRFVLTGVTEANLSANPFGIGTIRDDDATPELRINTSSSIVEDTDPADDDETAFITFNVGLNRISGQDVTFHYEALTPNVNSGQLRPATGDDFDARTASGNITIAAGTQSEEVRIGVFADELDEYNEYFKVVISQVTNATLKQSSSTGIIIDDDDAGTVKITAPNADNTAIEGVRDAVFPVELSEAPGRPIRIFYSITGQGNANPASPLQDLAPLEDGTGKQLLKQNSGFITIGPNQRNGAIRIAAIQDKLDEAELEDYRVTITRIDPSDWTVAAAADGTAVSTIEDRNPGFTNFDRNDGNQDYNPGAIDNGTNVILNGNQFLINGVSQVQSVLFSVISNNIGKAVASTDFEVLSATQIRAKVPAGAYSGRIRIVLRSQGNGQNATVLSPSGNNADRLFYVNAVATSFTPTRGVVRNTIVTIRGINLKDPNNPVTGVRFGDGGTATPVFGTDSGETIIRATVPNEAASGPITLITRNGTNYAPSLASFTVDGADTGGIRFEQTPIFTVFENSTGTYDKPVTFAGSQVPVTYNLQLRPALQNNPGRTQVAPRGNLVVRLSIIDDVPTGQRVRFPQIAVATGRNTISSGRTVDVTFDANTFQNKSIRLIDAGDDSIKPDFIGLGQGGAFQQQTPRILTLRASIITSGDPDLYPADTDPVGDPLSTPQISTTIERDDIHGLQTDIGTVFRVTEDQDSPRNVTQIKVNLANINNGVDVAADGKPVTAKGKYTNNPQPTVLNADGTVNRDAEPTAEVGLPFEVNAPDEALIRYFVRVPAGNGKFTTVYPGGAVFGPRIVMVYGNDQNLNEYYKYDHYIEVKGIDDNIQDGPQEFQINLDLGAPNQNGNSTDPEYNNLQLVTPFTLVNDDNEQSTGTNEPGFIFSPLPAAPAAQVPTLRVNEFGSTDFFRVRLRTKPAAGSKVVLRLQSSEPSEVQLIDPRDTTGKTRVETLDLVFFPDSNGSIANKESRWDLPITVQVVGVDDDSLDGNQLVTILTSTAENTANTLTTDPAYQTIDPIDPIVTNEDNEANGITVSPTNLVIDEGSTDTFTVKINTAPVFPVNITLTNLNPAVATATVQGGANGNRITFTPENWRVAQTVIVRGVADN